MRKPLLANLFLFAGAAAGFLLAGCSSGGVVGNVDHYVGIGRAFPPPSPTGQFDGSYYGTVTLVRETKSGICPDGGRGVMEVGDKRLSFAYAPLIIFNPAIQPDGKVHDEVGQAVLDGQIDKDDNLRMRVTTPECETKYRLSYIGNHS